MFYKIAHWRVVLMKNLPYLESVILRRALLNNNADCFKYKLKCVLGSCALANLCLSGCLQILKPQSFEFECVTDMADFIIC